MLIKQYIKGDPDSQEEGLPAEEKEKIKQLFLTFKDDDGEERHKKWLEKIAEGHFSFGAVDLEYIPKGAGSWKHQALETEEHHDKVGDKFPYNEEFLQSNWKYFHDALQAHRFVILHDILPNYGICAD